MVYLPQRKRSFNLGRSPKRRKIIEEAVMTVLFIATMLAVPFACMLAFG